ncbi:alpha-hydroxy acid oxidase [Phytohabitans suffuscus]|uniref:Alpha-hydroxy-acid oxidizing enzyme n=1 Tax=Phytohabitans suffuscus TaxID=624315 RepID=A0A6F8YSN6_9ACTN|nr:alpha-hydroxy acid oxidase [Phytohabitans suffuscus]BCB89157.1 alpha-hydroxy-acid oxidizing enzyme [Phytohabitans suffuscus]
MDALLTVAEYEAAAQELLPPGIWDYLSGGSGQERTLAANVDAFARLALRPRFLVDVSEPDLSTTLLGARLPTPIGVAPVAYHRLAHPEGEVATARAASLLVVSVFASRTLEEIAAAAAGPLWLQLYWFRRREVVTGLVRRAEDAGYQALVLTLDTPRVGRRLRDVRRGFAIPAGIVAPNLEAAVMAGTHEAVDGESALARHSREQFDPALRPADLAWLCAQTDLPVLVKGVLTARDAELALAHGAAGVVVSNHGGRQLDGAVASVDALAEVAAAVGGRGPVLLDGGVRTGVDVLRALALGASAVLVGRPALWGLAVGGESGARAVLDILAAELEDAMVLSGRPRLSDVDSSLLAGVQRP